MMILMGEVEADGGGVVVVVLLSFGVWSTFGPYCCYRGLATVSEL